MTYHTLLLAKGVSGGLQMQSINTVPEPESDALALMGLIGLARRRRA